MAVVFSRGAPEQDLEVMKEQGWRAGTCEHLYLLLQPASAMILAAVTSCRALLRMMHLGGSTEAGGFVLSGGKDEGF